MSRFSLVFFFALLLVAAFGSRFQSPLKKVAVLAEQKAAFAQFMTTHNKNYGSAEEMDKRFAIFQSNLAAIEKLNSEQDSATFGVNKFADLSPEEFKGQYLMPKFNGLTQPSAPLLKVENVGALPTSFDWRSKGAVTNVYDQGQCGSCWAFSATEAIESQWFLSGHPLVSLSMQQIVDCDKGRGDQGCNGGDTPTAYKYVMSAGGLDSLSTYPYTAKDGKCAFNANNVAGNISNWAYVTKNKNETQMQEGLVAKGPLSICVDAETWQYYTGGVISSKCSTSLDHCVLISGFQDFTYSGTTYPIWLVRNSWGTSWGYSGYIYIKRGSDLCGVADEVTIPVV